MPFTKMQNAYENTSTTGGSGAFTTETLDLAIGIDFIVLENGHLDLLSLMLDFFGGSVGLLLALLGTTTKAGLECFKGVRIGCKISSYRSTRCKVDSFWML